MFIEIQRVNQENLPDFLVKLQGSWKSSSLLWMQSNWFPVLQGIILNGWEAGTERTFSRFCRERGFSELLVRIEKPGQRWTRRRGGYTIPVSDARRLVDDLAEEGFLTMLLEPASPYADIYGVASVCDLATGNVDVEVVGPGFDASDILRSDTTPHERFEVWFDLKGIRSGEAQEPQIRQLHVVQPEIYKTSVQRRLTKIGARLRNPSFPEEVLEGASNSHCEQLRQDAVEYLRKTGHTLLLDHLNAYNPIPRQLLEVFLGQLIHLFAAAETSHLPWQALSVASSFLQPERLVMWDFFSTESQDTTLLSNVRTRPRAH